MKKRRFLTKFPIFTWKKPQKQRILALIAVSLLAISAFLSPTRTWAVAEIDVVWGTDPVALAVVGAGTSVTTEAVNFTPQGSTLLNTPVSLYFKVIHNDVDGDRAQLFLDKMVVMLSYGGFTFVDNTIPIFPSTIAPNSESGIFKIMLDANNSGFFAGNVEFRYNDSIPTGIQIFTFNINGIVATTPPVLF